jgi:hypothetical protein
MIECHHWMGKKYFKKIEKRSGQSREHLGSYVQKKSTTLDKRQEIDRHATPKAPKAFQNGKEETKQATLTV